MGHRLTEKGLTVDPEKTKCVDEWPVPQNIKEVQCFLGLVNYYRRFIPEYCSKSATLTNLSEAGAKWEWNETCDSSFTYLKNITVNKPVLILP